MEWSVLVCPGDEVGGEGAAEVHVGKMAMVSVAVEKQGEIIFPHPKK